jgi:type IV secretion system protein VirB5
MKRFLLVIALTLSIGQAHAQGIPVFDAQGLAQQLQQVAQLTEQLQTAKQQLDQAQQLYGSLNKLTDINSIGSLLNNPDIRRALPPEFSQYESLLRGNGSGSLGTSANSFLSNNRTGEVQGDDFYAQELRKAQTRNAGQMSAGQAMYDAASKRLDGIESLRARLGSAQDAKESMDLQTRLQVETAFLQTDVLRMQALRMVQQAEAQVETQRGAEEFKRNHQLQRERLQ